MIFALLATLGTWLVTALGAALVLFCKHTRESLLRMMLGFAAGVMIAASFWSLLAPAIQRAEETLSAPASLVVSIGFLCGALFLYLSDKVVSRAERGHSRALLLVLSITLHNIPEGLAVGVAFGALHGGYTTETLMGAISIAMGIGLQNFPEGAAVSLPLRREGFSRKRCFFWGQSSGMVEPVAGVIGAALVVYVTPLLPFALSFAAGAMILVAVHELIPACQEKNGDGPYLATMGIVLGFTVMMLLDVALG